MTILHQGCARREISPWLSQDTQSSDISADEIRVSGKSFKSLIVCGNKLLLCFVCFFASWTKYIQNFG